MTATRPFGRPPARRSNAKSDRFAANRRAKSARNAAIAENSSKTALVLGGGAPNSALMAGALAAFEEHGVRFDVVSTSGAGALIGLLWLAPRGATPAEALRNWVDAYVADSIYDGFPVNYKVFFKPGAMAEWYRHWLDRLPWMKAVTDEQHAGPWGRLWRDWVQLGLATLSPSSLNWFDVGLCARVPFVEAIVDFARIKDIAPYFYINAYNLTRETIDDFPREAITPAHFRAAFAFPFIYGPYRMDGCDYYEGATRDCLNFKDLVEKHTGLETIVVLDVLGTDALIRKPRNLYDSWVLSMIIPLVKTAEDNLELFALKHNGGWRRSEGAKADLLVLPFDVPERDLPQVLDWSHSNGQRLFEVGYRAAQAFLRGEGAALLEAPAQSTAAKRRRSA
jgi:predicted acylesterase/phospholipase RssA